MQNYVSNQRNIRIASKNLEPRWKSVPDRPFLTILEPRNKEIGEFCIVQERHATDFVVSKLFKVSIGIPA